MNKPYCYFDIDSRSLAYFKKTSGGIAELTPDEIREFHRTQIIEQSQMMLRSVETQVPSPTLIHEPQPNPIQQHRNSIVAKLEDPKDFGLVRIYCHPKEKVEISFSDLEKFLKEHRFQFSEAMRRFPDIDVYQNGVSIGYFPTAVRQDVKSTIRNSLYVDGLVTFDALADTFLDGDRQLHSGWLCYELQRQLQLSKAVLGPV